MNLEKNIRIIKSKKKLQNLVEEFHISTNSHKPLLIWFKSNTHLDVFKEFLVEEYNITSISCNNLNLEFNSTHIFHNYIGQMSEESLRFCASLAKEKNIKIIYLANMYEYKNRPDFTSELFDEVYYDIKSAIILNHMFTGDYLDKNIGHEVINLFRADDNKHYIYLCKDGVFNRDDVQVEYVVQVCRPIKTTNTLKIINVASNLKQHVKTDATPQYGKKSIYDIFKNNIEQQNVCVTFDAGMMSIPQKDLYIWTTGSIECKDNGVALENLNHSQQLREYIYEEYNEDWSVKKGTNYSCLQALITGWNTMEIGVDLPKVDSNYDTSMGVTEIYGVEGRELSYSDAISYFVEKYQKIFLDIFGSKDDKVLKVFREWKNIDILIECVNEVIVIENKIFSGLNGNDSTQLKKYKEIIEGEVINKKSRFYGKEIKYILLTPNHNLIIPNCEGWMRMEYKVVYDKLKNMKYNDNELEDFIKAIKPHTEIDYNFSVMKKRFARAIQNAK